MKNGERPTTSSLLDIGPRESRWRAAQRRRRRPTLTTRGRCTLAGLCALAIGGGLALVANGLRLDLAVPSPPAVSAASRPLGATGAPASPPAPEALLRRLPVTTAALDLPVTASPPDGGGPPPPPARAGDLDVSGRLVEQIRVPGAEGAAQPLRVEYTLEAELVRHAFRVLERGRVELGHVVLMDPDSGRVLAYASTDPERFPSTRAYPAASLVKVITAAAALQEDPGTADIPCRYDGNPYKLTPSRIDPPPASSGRTVSLRKALATSNNQCFAQLAVHALGAEPLLDAIARFGWLDPPAPAHAPGTVAPGEDRYDLGRLGCGLAGCRITPLHAVQLAASLAHGELVTPYWIDRIVDAEGRELPLPPPPARRRVLSRELAGELRAMLVDTTRRGTARRAFRKRNGRPLLGDIAVAGKTGSLSGKDPDGRYEWFAGVAPADEPRIAVAVLVVQSPLWWRNASQIAADVLRGVFCMDGPCDARAPIRSS